MHYPFTNAFKAEFLVFSLFKVALVGNSCPALLSATTDVLTAIYRDKRLALMVPQSTLKNSLRCSCEALLDSRFASPIPVDVNVLDADARLVKAINKLAIQAAIGTSRTCSLATLMSLQQEYCEKSRQPLKNEGIMYARRSRIITKLFARVIRSEESSQYPFRNASTMNLNAIFTVAEGVLQNVSNCEITGSPTGCNFASAIELVKLLMHAIANAYGAGHGGEAVALGCVLAQNDFDLNSRIGCLICKVFGAVSAPELKSREGEFAAGTYTDCRENKRQISVVETADENEHAAIETNSDSASKSPINFENSTNTRKARDTR